MSRASSTGAGLSRRRIIKAALAAGIAAPNLRASAPHRRPIRNAW